MQADKTRYGSSLRHTLVLASFAVAICLLFIALLCIGAVSIPMREVVSVLTSATSPDDTYSIIILQSRLPMAIAALLSGAALSAAGLLMQTTFRNPLAGPSILGVSSGASLGVALVMLGANSIGIAAGFSPVVTILGALIGAGVVIAILLAFSATLRNPVMLLIVGVMVSYLASSVISLLNFFAPSQDVKSFVVWGLGSFSALRLDQIAGFALPLIAFLIVASMLAKPLNALLLGERYASSMGYSMRRLRTLLLVTSGVLTALVTAYCGPIGFIGLIVPHIARILTGTSNHLVLIPATILAGAAVTMLCALGTVIPSAAGVLPINAITPIIGVPLIFYIIINTRRLNYFN